MFCRLISISRCTSQRKSALLSAGETKMTFSLGLIPEPSSKQRISLLTKFPFNTIE